MAREAAEEEAGRGGAVEAVVIPDEEEEEFPAEAEAPADGIEDVAEDAEAEEAEENRDVPILQATLRGSCFC